MSIINKLFGRPSPLKETLFEDITSVLENTKRKSFAIEYTLDTNARTVLVFDRNRHVVLVYNSDKPLNIEERLMWASDSIHPDAIEKAKSISQDIDTNRYMSFVHRFGHTGDFIDYINVIYRDYSLQSLIDLQRVYPENVVKRNIVDLNSVDTEKFDFLDLPVDKLEKVLERRRARYIGTLKSYGVPESELSHYIFYNSEDMENHEDIKKIIRYATIEKLSFDELFDESNGFLWWDIVETALIFVDRKLIEIADNRTRQFVELFDVEATLTEKQHYTEHNVDHKTLEANFEEMLQEVNESAEVLDGDFRDEEEEQAESSEEIVEKTFNILQNMSDIETVDSDLIEDDETEYEREFYEEDYDEVKEDEELFHDDFDEPEDYEEEVGEEEDELLDYGDFRDEEDEIIRKELDEEYGMTVDELDEDSDESIAETDREQEIMEIDNEQKNTFDEDDLFLDDSHEETEDTNVVLHDFYEIDFQDDEEDEIIRKELDEEYGMTVDELDEDSDESITETDREQEIMEIDNEQKNTFDEDALYESAVNAFVALEDKWYDEKFNKESQITVDEDFEYTVELDDEESFEYIDIDEEESVEDDLPLDEYYDEEEYFLELDDEIDYSEHDVDSERTIRLPDLSSLFENEEVSTVSTIESGEDNDFVNSVVSPENTLKMLGVEANDFGNKFKDLIKEKRNAEERLAVLPGLIQKCYQESEEIETLLESTETKIDEIQKDVNEKKALMEAAIEEYNKSSEKLDTYSARGVEYRQKIKRIFENIEGYETEEKFYNSVKESATELIGRAVNETPETVSNFSDILDSINSRREKERREGLVELNDITKQILEAHPIEVYENEGGGVLEEDLKKEPNENQE